MSTFIELLRQHHSALKRHYYAQMNGDAPLQNRATRSLTMVLQSLSSR